MWRRPQRSSYVRQFATRQRATRRRQRPRAAATRPKATAATGVYPDLPRLGCDLIARGMKTPISSIPNLGPASEAQFAKAGIDSAEDLRALGADAAYRRLLASGTAPHFIGYYVLHMALQGRPWNDCTGDERKALRAQFDAIKAEHLGSDVKTRSDLEAALQFFGVIEAKKRG